jgi:uncharacterized protein
MSTKIQPVQSSGRIEIVDFIRGFALFGILMVNMPLMNAPFTTEIGEFILWKDPANHSAITFIRLFFTGKFYTIFSMLFGIGFYLFIRKAEEGNRQIVSLYRFRLLWLLIFGILHIVFLWYGDILLIYALAGFIMVWFRKKSVKTLVIWAAIFMSVPVLLTSFFAFIISVAQQMPGASEEIGHSFHEAFVNMKLLTENALKVYPNGTFSEIIRMRLSEYANMAGAIIFFIPNVLAMFLVGMALAKKEVFSRLSVQMAFFKKMFLFALPVAIAGNIGFVYFAQNSSMVKLSYNSAFYVAGMSIGGVALALVYISLIALSFQKIYPSGFAKAIISTGKMALTNYIMQSVICTTLFFSYGFGLYGKVNIWQGIILTVVIFFVQVVFSQFFMKRFQYGPFEWLWRSLTYRRVQKMKRTNSPD